MNKNATLRLVLSAMFLAIGLVLPFFTGQIQQIGNMLLPMHIPVFLCAFICGWQYAGTVGLSLPLIRSIWFGMPMLYPNAIAMSIELAVYGIAAGLIYRLIKCRRAWAVYAAMLPAMLLGRIVWGGAQYLLLGIKGSEFTFQAFFAGAFGAAVPGIILQLVLVPAIVAALNSKGYVLNEHNG